MRRDLMLLGVVALLALAGCESRAKRDCDAAVAQFRATLRTDPTLASVPDDAISAARHHRDDGSVSCELANRFANDAEEARRRGPVESPTPIPTIDEANVVGRPTGTPRVSFAITPRTVETEPPAIRHDVVAPEGHAEEPTPESVHRATSGGTPPDDGGTPTPASTPEVDAKAQCHAQCASVANFQARIACNQRCDGATPLPGATDEPVIVH